MQLTQRLADNYYIFNIVTRLLKSKRQEINIYVININSYNKQKKEFLSRKYQK